MSRNFLWRLLCVTYCFLGVCATAWSQASNYQTTAPKARSIDTGQLPAFQNLSNINGQARNLLNSMYSNNAGSTTAMPRSQPAASFGGGNAGISATKPFDSYSPQPTVSPYLNLFRVDLNGNNDFNYSTLVQPQLQQRQLNQQLQEQALQNSRRVQKIAAQGDYNPEGAKDQYPTGHQTVFSYTGHYFPAVRPNQKRTTQQQQ